MCHAIASDISDPRSQRPGACTQALHTETGRSREATNVYPVLVWSEKAYGRTPDIYAHGKSDGGILSMKRMNKGVQPENNGQPPAEFVEETGQGSTFYQFAASHRHRTTAHSLFVTQQKGKNRNRLKNVVCHLFSPIFSLVRWSN